MLLRPDKEAVIFKLRNPTRITTVIPTSKVIDHNESQFVAVPHRPDETRVLRNLGFDVPDPMPLHYSYPGPFKPFESQIITASFAAMQDRCYILNSMGLGKTITSLWSYDYLHKKKQVNKVLVVCPLSTMERTWADAVFSAFPHLTAVTLHGSAAKRKKMLAIDADIYIINTDGLGIVKQELHKRPDIDLVIVDELAMYRNAGTDRWKFLNEICNKQCRRKVWGLTGQPTPKAPSDAWAQCRIVTPDNPKVPKYFTKFKDMVMRQVSQYKWVPRDNAMEIVHEMMQPAVRFKLDDCIDLPEQTFSHHDVELTPEQKKAYNQMADQLRAEVAQGQVTAVNEAVKTGKLIQIALGVAYGVDHEHLIIPAKPRIDALLELIDQSEGKVLVFVPLTGALHEVAKQVTAAGHDVRIVCGETKKGERDEIFGAFQNTNSVDVLVANPATMSHGLTLTAATTIVWFAPINSNDIFGQANARVRRPGQTRTTVIATLAATPVERKMYARLRNQEAMQGLLLDMFEGQTQMEAA